MRRAYYSMVTEPIFTKQTHMWINSLRNSGQIRTFYNLTVNAIPLGKHMTFV